MRRTRRRYEQRAVDIEVLVGVVRLASVNDCPLAGHGVELEQIDRAGLRLARAYRDAAAGSRRFDPTVPDRREWEIEANVAAARCYELHPEIIESHIRGLRPEAQTLVRCAVANGLYRIKRSEPSW